MPVGLHRISRDDAVILVGMNTVNAVENLLVYYGLRDGSTHGRSYDYDIKFFTAGNNGRVRASYWVDKFSHYSDREKTRNVSWSSNLL